MQKVTTFLWFDGNAEEAMNFYVGIFSAGPGAKNAKIVSRMPGPGGKLMGGTFEIDGQQFMTLNGGPMFKFTEAISLFVKCDTQEEIDYKWEKLSEGGEKSMCGWLKDKYGLSWQIIPPALGEMLGDKDRVKAGKVMEAMMQMSKIDIAELKKAYESVGS